MDPDIIAGYNSSNFDVPYLMKRAKKLGIDFDVTRYGEEAREENHGLIKAVKIPGRINLDVYNVARFVSIVGASEKLLKINRFTLGDVYRAITGDTKITVDKKNIWQQWDGTKEELENLAEYSLSDSISLLMRSTTSSCRWRSRSRRSPALPSRKPRYPPPASS